VLWSQGLGDDHARARATADYVAALTDHQAFELHSMLREGSRDLAANSI